MSAFDKAFHNVQALVSTFSSNIHHYMSPGYSEAEARQDFIDNFFTALGWDVRHKHQTNPYEQEVKIEKSQKQQNESARKRADYAFFIGPNYKDEVFFAEAKKPSVLIGNNPQHYFQTIKYGWNSGCPICALTDFEEFAIIDCRQKPDIKYALNGKHKVFKYTDYTDKEKFAEIYWLFSREAVAANSIQKYAATLPKPKGKIVQKALFKGGYQAIDDSFLEYIDGIRENIAKAFKKANENLNSEELTEATQRTVDRLVFIRFLEDKFIEPEEHVSEWKSWKHFITDCRRLDAKYNGVVFKEHFIDKPHFIGADEKLFLDICSDISGLNSPYDFNYIPIHILGSIYERFLGKIVVATNKRVHIEEKPEVRKAGGVYYTPKYIVDYIVKNTVGKIIEGLTPKQVAEKRFADIACGSGSFLIGVYDYLLDYHKQYYTGKLAGKTTLDARSEDFGNVDYKDGQWVLSLKLKQDILINNIYGVDIDRQAVEVTQLSLFLKMLEDESLGSTTVKQGAMFSKVLPDLSKNIICGNSLIGWDIMQGQLFENDELKKLNPMDYETAFPVVLRNGGFDAVVGNPPYGATIDKTQDNYYRDKFTTANYQLDTYTLFIEKAFRKTRNKGKIGIIIPTAWVASTYDIKFRTFLANQTSIDNIVVAPKRAFQDATVETGLLILTNDIPNNEFEVIRWDLDNQKSYPVKISEIQSHPNKIFPLYTNSQNLTVVNKIRKSKSTVSKIAEVVWGVKVYEKGKGTPPQKGNENLTKKFHSSERTKNTHRPLIGGSEINRYLLTWKGGYIDYGKWLAAPRTPNWFSNERIVIREVTAKGVIQGTYICDDYVFSNSVDGVRMLKESDISILYLLGIINSKLISFYHSNTSANAFKGAFPKVLLQDLRELPLPEISSNKRQQHDQIVSLVTQILEAKKQLTAAKTESDKNFLQNKCNSLDRQIDKLVYELYGLTEEEINIVENSK